MDPMRLLICAALTLSLAACTVTDADPTASGSPAPSTAKPQPVAVYYALTTAEGLGPRLVREFHQVAAKTQTSVVEQVRVAATEMLTHNALDPDYANLWPDNARVA